MIRNMFGGTKCRTIDKVDVFGDSSGVALYQLDGNANDTGGQYHGTETAVTYGGGVYSRGFACDATARRITTPNINIPTTSFSVSCWFRGSAPIIALIQDGNNNMRFGSNDAGTYYGMFIVSGGVYTRYISTTPVSTSTEWRHYVATIGSGTLKVYLNNAEILSTALSQSLSTWYTAIGSLLANTTWYYSGSHHDQVRIFNRAITATEVATLYAECAPTSTVNNINPFMDGSLKALYKFDGDATDATGVYNGTATNVTYGTGKFGQCAVFNGVNTTNVNLGTPTVLDPDTTGHLSISCWVNVTIFNTYNAVVTSVTATNPPDGTGCSYYLFVSSDNKIHLLQSDGTITTSTAISSVVLTSGWHHIVGTISVGGTNRLYLDGILVGTAAAKASTRAIEPVYIGKYGNTIGFNGSIEQVRFFNKALTPLEVASLYNETTPLEEPMYKLVDPFRDGSGKALYRLEGNALDESGNYNGTATSVTYGAGQFGRCGVFNGTAYVTTSLNTVGTSCSISFFIKLNNRNNSLILFNETTNKSYLFTTTTGSLVFQTEDARFAEAAEFGFLDTTTFTHVTVTKEGSTVSFYRNGTKVASTNTGNGGILSTSSFAYNRISGASWMMNGSIDQVRFFNRALTATEVSKLYTGENDVL